MMAGTLAIQCVLGYGHRNIMQGHIMAAIQQVSATVTGTGAHNALTLINLAFCCVSMQNWAISGRK